MNQIIPEQKLKIVKPALSHVELVREKALNLAIKYHDKNTCTIRIMKTAKEFEYYLLTGKTMEDRINVKKQFSNS